MPGLTPEQVRALGQVLGATEETEIDCETFLDHVAELVEHRRQGRVLPGHLALVEAHERLCANCREECAALALALLEQD